MRKAKGLKQNMQLKNAIKYDAKSHRNDCTIFASRALLEVGRF
jgi:hypothetical protein